MDPLCHTLAGATLAHTGLKRLTPLATATLIAAANVPDVDAVANLWGGDVSLQVRRGHTHGVVAMVLLPVALAAVVLLIDRAWRRRAPERPPARWWPLLALSALGTWSHPVLDWMNVYGVRLLMPFSERWFYADALFIVDPWLWLLLAAAAAVAGARRPLGTTGWLVLASGTTVLMFTAGEAPLVAKALWLAGLAAIGAARLATSGPTAVPRIARTCLVASVCYIALMMAGSRLAVARAEAWLASHQVAAGEVMADPVRVDPFVRELIVVSGDRYRFYRTSLLDGSIQPNAADVPIGGPTPVTEAALRAPAVRGLAGWLRFPSFEVQPLADGYRVTIRDVRYSRLGEMGRGIGVGSVELDAALQPR